MRSYHTFHTNNIMNNNILENPSLEYSQYGIYKVGDDEMTLSFPNNTITITRKSKNQYLFCRKSGESEYRQRINMDSTLSIQIAPILPLNIPEEKTSLLYLDFNEPLYLDKKIRTKITVPYPIEIGVFIHDEENSELLDCFSCDPELSRFALYGTPTDGHFCKYALINMDEKHDKFCYGSVDVIIQNNQTSSVILSKIVFDAALQDVYCSEYNNDVLLDSLVVNIDEHHLSHASISVEKIQNQDQYFTSPRIQSKTSKPFVMTEGYD